MGQRADHLEDLEVGQRADHLVGQKVDHSADLMEGQKAVQKGQEVPKVVSLLSERLVLPGPVRVVPLEVREEGTVLARIVPV